ncbi:PucR family transcriptional regulator [Microbacterium sp. NPDC076768]|uniref:PucR family transcriptional regulator n=1 Tax=Microbacterium sp. NPDC076768 TaxID=3154858 RepID=UPI003434867E
MSVRRDFGSNQTDRPGGAADALLTVADVLAMTQLQVGDPTVVVGGEALNVGVRWAHISDSADVARLLDGGELLLTTGAGWPEEPADLRHLARSLCDAGVAGIVVELGSHHADVPDPVVEVCRSAGIALISLASEVKFVAVTEAVHRALIAAQTGALRERQHLHEVFTELSLRGAPADVVVAETARSLGAPVLLENLAREVIAVEGLRISTADVLASWQENGAQERVPVQARGMKWGTLVALAGPPHPAGRATVLQQGATALAFGCLADGGDQAWTLLAQQGLIDDLLGARFTRTEDMAARLEASGLPLSGRRCYAMVLHGAGATEGLADRALRERVKLVTRRIGDADVALVSTPEGVHLSDEVVTRIAGAGRTAFLGPAAFGVLELLASVRAALDLAEGDRGGGAHRVHRAEDRPLDLLVASLRDDRRVQAHSERMLAPLLQYDRERRGDLLEVLSALVAHPGNRSAAAVASHLSRSVFYQRITLISDLLGADLEDGETLSALHLALLTHRRSYRVPQL